MGWLSSILRALAPIAVEHGSQVLRDSLRSRAAQAQTGEGAAGPDPLQLLASDIEQLKKYAVQLRTDLEALNAATAAREERQRKWLLVLVVWNLALTLGVIIFAVIALRH